MFAIIQSTEQLHPLTENVIDQRAWLQNLDVILQKRKPPTVNIAANAASRTSYIE
jgi:hypothetical protein